MKNNNNETKKVVEFNIENILSGAFAAENSTSGSGVKTFDSFASLRLLLESGQVLTEEAHEKIKNMSYKWFYYKKISDNNSGNIIITFHTKKAPKDWIYAIIDTKTGEVISSTNSIQDAKKQLI